MKKRWYWIIAGIVSLIILLFLLFVPVIAMDGSWWIFLGSLIGIAFIWMIIGIVVVIIRLKKIKPIVSKIDMSDAKNLVIHNMKYDEDNPDNFRVDRRVLMKIGREGTEKTPIGYFEGVGTELNQKRIVVVNLNNPKKELSGLIDPTDKEISEAIRLMADNPPDPEVWEETITKMDLFNRPVVTTRVRKPSGVVEKAKQEEQKVEEVNAM